MSDFQAGVNVCGSVATMPEPRSPSTNPRKTEAESILEKIRQPVSTLLPKEPMSAYAFHLFAGLNTSKDPRIQMESFYGERKERYSDLLEVSRMTIPTAVPTDELEQYLASKGKRIGDEFDLFAFAIANPKDRPAAIAAWCKWVAIKGKNGQDIFVPQHLVNKPNAPIFLPCLSSAAGKKDLLGYCVTPIWNPAIEIVVTDIP